MKKFDTLVEEVEKSLMTEAPDYHENAVLADEHTVAHSEDVAEAKERGKKLEDFEGLEVYVLERNITERMKHYIFCFFENNQCECMVKIYHTKHINPPVSIGKRPVGTTDEFVLYSADQRHEEQNLGLARKIVLNYLSELFPSFTSGQDANRFGRPFWEKLLRGALEKGFKVVGSLNKEERGFKPNDFEKYWLSDRVIDPAELSHVSNKTLAGRKCFKIIFKNVA